MDWKLRATWVAPGAIAVVVYYLLTAGDPMTPEQGILFLLCLAAYSLIVDLGVEYTKNKR